MKTSRDFTFTAIIFLAVTVWMAMNVQPVWWSILGLVLVATVVVMSSVRAVIEYRRERAKRATAE